MKTKILVTGAGGQIGSELVPALRAEFGAENVIASDIKASGATPGAAGLFEQADATQAAELEAIIIKHQISVIYHLVGVISAVGEQNPDLAWRVNMASLKNVLDLAVSHKIDRVFWPSSIAAFGPSAPREMTPQATILEPTTIYGVTKVAGELLCNYYHHKYGLDVRSVRYPGIISWQTKPGGGTTDYACAIYYDALEKGHYDCFVSAETILPMMYMPDAIRAAMSLMAAAPEKIKVRTSYNLTALDFSAQELADNVSKYVSGFTCAFVPDARQKIADSWPKSIDDSAARADWGWQPEFGLDDLSQDMIKNLKLKLAR